MILETRLNCYWYDSYSNALQLFQALPTQLSYALPPKLSSGLQFSKALQLSQALQFSTTLQLSHALPPQLSYALPPQLSYSLKQITPGKHFVGPSSAIKI